MNFALLTGIAAWVCSVQATLDGSQGPALEPKVGKETPIVDVRLGQDPHNHSRSVWIGKRFRPTCRFACDTFYGLCLPQVYDPENVFYPICEQHLKFRAAPKDCMDCMFENGLEGDTRKRFRVGQAPGPVVKIHSGWPSSKQTSRLRKTTKSADATGDHVRGVKGYEIAVDGDTEKVSLSEMLHMKGKMTTESQDTSTESVRFRPKQNKRIPKTTKSADTSTEKSRVNDKSKKRVTKPMRVTKNPDASTENGRIIEKPKKRITKPARTESPDASSENARVTEKPKKRVTKPMRAPEGSDTPPDKSEKPNEKAKSAKGKANSPKRSKNNQSDEYLYFD